MHNSATFSSDPVKDKSFMLRKYVHDKLFFYDLTLTLEPFMLSWVFNYHHAFLVSDQVYLRVLSSENISYRIADKKNIPP